MKVTTSEPLPIRPGVVIELTAAEATVLSAILLHVDQPIGINDEIITVVVDSLWRELDQWEDLDLYEVTTEYKGGPLLISRKGEQ